MRENERFKIGLSFFATEDDLSIWSNGAGQNIIFLYWLLQQSPEVEAIYMVNGGYEPTANTVGLLKSFGITLCRFEEIKDNINVLIQGGSQLNAEEVRHIRNSGGIAIAYFCGNSYITAVENFCKNSVSGWIVNGAQYDEIWMHEHHYKICKDLYEICLRAPVKVLPHIWSPFFIEKSIQELKTTHPALEFFHPKKPVSGIKRIASFEPNINVVKSCVTPILLCEAAYRKNPQAISEIYFCNTFHLKDNKAFSSLVQGLDIVKQGLASFEARYPIAYFLAKYTDIILTHQWENGFNYIYYEAFYGNYPLVHNSIYFKDIGYYYEEFNVEQGAQALLKAIHCHGDNISSYRDQCRTALYSLSPDNPHVVEAHISAMRHIQKKKITPPECE
jgi:hypothetical protein